MRTTININLHNGVAEKGKLFAIQGNHKEAIRYYKEAIRMCRTLPNAEEFIHHYNICIMESLELMESYNEVIEFCDKCLDFLKIKDSLKNNLFVKNYAASVLERKGIQFLLLNEKEKAIDSFKSVQHHIDIKLMPLTNELLNWALRGLTITHKQILELQKKYLYFIVRKDAVNVKIAVELPRNINPF